jgi:cyclin-dependent kinase 2
LEGIYCCHSHRILHRDLKPSNILLNYDSRTQSFQVKLADFGLSRSFDVPVKPITREVVTLWYRAPEILLGDFQYSTPVDIWSIGCIFYELTTRRALFPGDSELEELRCIFHCLGTPNEYNWPGVTSLPVWRQHVTFPNWTKKTLSNQVTHLPPIAIDLLVRMLEMDPSRRVTATAALRHEFL